MPESEGEPGVSEENRRLIQEKIAQMLRDGILEASDVKDGEPLLEVTEKGLAKRVEAEISEKELDKRDIIAVLIDKFVKSDSSYGELTGIEGDVQYVYDLVRGYVCQEKLDVYALRFGDKILLSRTDFEFEEVRKAIEMYSVLVAKREIVELWDDCQNKILHLLIMPLRKHFPIGYSNEESKLRMVEKILGDDNLSK